MARAYATSNATSSQVVSYSMYIMPARGIHFIRYGNRIVLLKQIFKYHIVWKYQHIVLSNVLILYCIIVIQWKSNTDIISYSILQSTFLITYVFHNWNRGRRECVLVVCPEATSPPHQQSIMSLMTPSPLFLPGLSLSFVIDCI